MAGYTRTAARMAGGSRQAYGRSYRAYRYEVDGSAARVPQAWPDTYRRTDRQVRSGERTRHKKKQAAYRSLNILLVIGMAALVVCCSVLMLFATMKLSIERREITSLQADLVQVQEKNNSLREALNQPMDLNELYRRATKELGMVYPDESQIVYYSDGSEDFVRQFADIPNRN